MQKLIADFDSGDKDGKIQLREFLEMYAAGFDSQNSHSTEDVLDSFRALDVDPFDEKVRRALDAAPRPLPLPSAHARPRALAAKPPRRHAALQHLRL